MLLRKGLPNLFVSFPFLPLYQLLPNQLDLLICLGADNIEFQLRSDAAQFLSHIALITFERPSAFRDSRAAVGTSFRSLLKGVILLLDVPVCFYLGYLTLPCFFRGILCNARSAKHRSRKKSSRNGEMFSLLRDGKKESDYVRHRGSSWVPCQRQYLGRETRGQPVRSLGQLLLSAPPREAHGAVCAVRPR
jgi:hypothetical protein